MQMACEYNIFVILFLKFERVSRDYTVADFVK